MNQYLESTNIIDWKTPPVHDLAKSLATSQAGAVDVARCCFEWVRDEIKHSGDVQADVVTCRASDVLRERTGWCYAKSHLLAALLRGNGLAAGLCYQRLQRGDGDGFALHGLCAVLLPDFGWYRVDARGNKKGVDAQFSPPTEQLAWPATDDGELDLPEIWPEPLPTVIACLTQNRGWIEVRRNLPDVELIRPR